MRITNLVAFAVWALVGIVDAHGAFVSYSTWCRRGDGGQCTQAQLRDPSRYKQILVLPAGFNSSEYATFIGEYDKLIANMENAGPSVYSNEHRDRILYVASWTPGGALNTPEALFEARLLNNPFRGKALTLNQDAVIGAVNAIRSDELPWLRPWSVLVIFNNLENGVTANASPPTQFGKPYGIARVTRQHLNNTYVAPHEVAHSGLNLLDEYIEDGLQDLSIRSLDILTPLVLWDFGDFLGNLFGVYQYQISEIISANGNDNIDISRYPSRVNTAGYNHNEYENEGGMFFGKGTYHDKVANLMGSNRPGMSPEDGFDWDHSASQRGVIRQAFDPAAGPQRPNDRIRNAGPVNGWPVVGSAVNVLLFDADKNHHYQPTRSYEVQVGWYARLWNTCWWGPFPYPCSTNTWTTAQKTVSPTPRSIVLKGTALYGVATIARDVVCGLGLGSLPVGGTTVDICALPVDQLAGAFLPSLTFIVPYQQVSVPASQWSTKYYWRFRTRNAARTSGWTGWSSFYRSF